jgi:hypothetical protein
LPQRGKSGFLPQRPLRREQTASHCLAPPRRVLLVPHRTHGGVQRPRPDQLQRQVAHFPSQREEFAPEGKKRVFASETLATRANCLPLPRPTPPSVACTPPDPQRGSATPAGPITTTGSPLSVTEGGICPRGEKAGFGPMGTAQQRWMPRPTPPSVACTPPDPQRGSATPAGPITTTGSPLSVTEGGICPRGEKAGFCLRDPCDASKLPPTASPHPAECCLYPTGPTAGFSDPGRTNYNDTGTEVVARDVHFKKKN